MSSCTDVSAILQYLAPITLTKPEKIQRPAAKY